MQFCSNESLHVKSSTDTTSSMRLYEFVDHWHDDVEEFLQEITNDSQRKTELIANLFEEFVDMLYEWKEGL